MKAKKYIQTFPLLMEAVMNQLKHSMDLLSPEEMEEISMRIEKCSGCDFNVNGICSPKKCKEVNGEKVCGCGCLLELKIKSFKKANKCPLNQW